MAVPRLLYLVTEDWYFCSHRLGLGRAAREAGFDVTVATHVDRHAAPILDAGLGLWPLPLSRRSAHPLREAALVRSITALYRGLRPDIAHHVAMKPVLYGSMAAWRTGIPHVVNALPGLGYAFSSTDLGARLVRPAIELAFRAALDRPNSRVLLQNPDDVALLTGRQVVDPSRVVLIRGSGVDVTRFQPSPEPAGTPLIVLPARLLRDKGVEEFVAAARRLRHEGVAARFALVGKPDPDNPASISPERLRAWQEEGTIEYWGFRQDMPEVLRSANVVCLPSYREGNSNSLIEAAASGRPIVTCDVPGCRDVVRDGDNGLLVPARDPAALAAALRRLALDPALRARLGARGRERAVEEFSLSRIVGETLDVYRACLEGRPR
jgi:glycosyltransferase involved in cell wall biosynthesis